MAHKEKTNWEVISGSLRSAGTLVAMQAERTKLSQIALPAAYAELGRAAYEEGSRREEFAKLFAALDSLTAAKGKAEQAGKSRSPGEKFLDKAKQAVADVADLARTKAHDLQIFQASAVLGEALYTKSGEESTSDPLLSRVASHRAALARLDTNIKTLSDAKAFGQVSMRTALLGVGGVCVALALLWVVFPRRAQPDRQSKSGSSNQLAKRPNRAKDDSKSSRKEEPHKAGKVVASPGVSSRSIPTVKSAYLNADGEVVIYDRPHPAGADKLADERAESEYREAEVALGKWTSDLRKAEIRNADSKTIRNLQNQVAQAEVTRDVLKKQLLEVRSRRHAKEDRVADYIDMWEAEKRGRDATGRKFISLGKYLASKHVEIPPYPANKVPPIPGKEDYRALLKAPKRRSCGQLLCSVERLLVNGSTLQTEASRDMTVSQLMFYNREAVQSYFWKCLSKPYVLTEGASEKCYISIWKPEVLDRGGARVSLEALQLNFGRTVVGSLKPHGDAFSDRHIQELWDECGQDVKEMPFPCVDGVVYLIGSTKEEKDFPELGKTRVDLRGSFTLLKK